MSLFRSTQWAVMDWGLTSVKPGAPYEYEIPADRLLGTGDRGGIAYDWPLHVAEKTWVELPLLVEAFERAIDTHVGKYKGTVDSVLMLEGLRAAGATARRNRN